MGIAQSISILGEMDTKFLNIQADDAIERSQHGT